jgi:hypothetical protein
MTSRVGFSTSWYATRVSPPPPSRPAAVMNDIDVAVPTKYGYTSSSSLQAGYATVDLT